MFERFVLLWLMLFAVVGYFAPAPFVAVSAYLDLVIIAAMFFVGTLLRADEFTQVLKRWPTVLGGVLLQYTSMPLLAFAAATLFELSPGLTIGVVMTGIVPGAMSSNAITLLAKGNVSYSVSMTTLATIAAPFLIPFWLLTLLGKNDANTDALGMMIQLVQTVAAPVLIGWIAARFLPKFAGWCRTWGPMASMLAVFWLMATVVAKNRGQIGLLSLQVLPALVLLNFSGYLAGWLGGKLLRLEESSRRALVIEIGMQNAGLGTVLVTKWFAGYPEAAVPTAVYTFGCILTGAGLAQFWSQYPPKTDSPNEPADEANATDEASAGDDAGATGDEPLAARPGEAL
ncbi:MAG TPA: bile acid:sodium symporter family protein [Pirellulales bacterium]